MAGLRMEMKRANALVSELFGGCLGAVSALFAGFFSVFSKRIFLCEGGPNLVGRRNLNQTPRPLRGGSEGSYLPLSVLLDLAQEEELEMRWAELGHVPIWRKGNRVVNHCRRTWKCKGTPL